MLSTPDPDGGFATKAAETSHRRDACATFNYCGSSFGMAPALDATGCCSRGRMVMSAS